MIKYILCPGYIISKNDGDEHYINAKTLQSLYMVDPKECVVKSDAPGWKPPKGVIYLVSKYNVDYSVCRS